MKKLFKTGKELNRALLKLFIIGGISLIALALPDTCYATTFNEAFGYCTNFLNTWAPILAGLMALSLIELLTTVPFKERVGPTILATGGIWFITIIALSKNTIVFSDMFYTAVIASMFAYIIGAAFGRRNSVSGGSSSGGSSSSPGLLPQR